MNPTFLVFYLPNLSSRTVKVQGKTYLIRLSLKKKNFDQIYKFKNKFVLANMNLIIMFGNEFT